MKNGTTNIDPIRLAAWSIFLGLIMVVLVFGRDLLIPLSIAIVLWVLIDAIRDLFRKVFTSLPQGVLTLISVLSILVLYGLVINIVISQMAQLESLAPIYQERFNTMANELMTELNLEAIPTTQALLGQVNLGAIFSWVGDSVTVLMSDIFLVLIYLGFLIAEEKSIPLKLTRFSSDQDNAKRLSAITMDISNRIKAYLGMKTLMSLLTGGGSYLILLLVDVDFAALWSLLIFLLNFIPNIGSLLGIFLPAMISLIQFDTLTPFFVVVAGIGAINFVIGNILEPSLMGKSLNMSSLMLLLSLSFWGLVWGLPGMFLSVPLMVMIGIICAHTSGLQWFAILLSGDGKISTEQ